MRTWDLAQNENAHFPISGFCPSYFGLSKRRVLFMAVPSCIFSPVFFFFIGKPMVMASLKGWKNSRKDFMPTNAATLLLDGRVTYFLLVGRLRLLRFKVWGGTKLWGGHRAGFGRAPKFNFLKKRAQKALFLLIALAKTFGIFFFALYAN